MGSTRGIAARAGRWSAQHRFKAIAGWLAFVIAATAIGGAIGTQTHRRRVRRRRVEARRRRDRRRLPGGVLGVGPGRGQRADANRPRFRRTVAEATAALRATDGVARARSPYAPGAEGRAISADRHSGLIEVELDAAGVSDPDWEEIVAGRLDTLATLDAEHPGFAIEQFGCRSSVASGGGRRPPGPWLPRAGPRRPPSPSRPERAARTTIGGSWTGPRRSVACSASTSPRCG